MKRGIFIAGHGEFEGIVDGAARRVRAVGGGEYDLAGVSFLPPCRPSKILCVGVNYRDALDARNLTPPSEPLIRVTKPASCQVGHLAPVVKPSWAGRLFFEGELGVVIATRCRGVRAARWRDVVAGYTIFNDFGVRDLQPAPPGAENPFPLAQLVKWKASDTFGPTGPWIEDDLEPGNLRIRTRVNGEVRQDSTTANMVFDLPFLIEYITSFATLEPGDLISTGTPAGAGPVEPGDVVEVEIEGIGVLENSIVDEAHEGPRSG